MDAPEIAVWRAWLKVYQGDYDHYDYNVRVGPGSDPGPTFPAEARRMAIVNSKARIDAVAWRQGYPTVIEVKEYATCRALGQLQHYTYFFQQENPNFPAPKMTLVCGAFQGGLDQTAQSLGISVEIAIP